MAILKDSFDTELVNMSFRVYGDAPHELSIALSIDDGNGNYGHKVFRLSKDECARLGLQLLNTAQLIKTAEGS